MFRQSKRRTAGRKNFENGLIMGSSNDQALLDTIYSSKLSFYKTPPVGEITLDEFETWAIDRLKILGEIESCLIRNKPYKEIESIIKPLLSTLMPLSSSNAAVGSEKLVKERKKDHYSHFILRLCFCRSNELREKFLKSEVYLFKVRFNSLTLAEQQQFISSLNLPWEFISPAEKSELSTNLFNSISPSLSYQLNLDEGSKRQFFENENFIKIPFEFVADLVSQRCIYVQKGMAYVPQFQQLNLLCNEFSNQLTKDLVRTSHALPRLDEDDRLLPILTHLSTGYSLTNYRVDDFSALDPDNEINANSITSKKITSHFPLCSKNLLTGLVTNHHLKYTARQQFSLFLKGIGLSLDDALQFWSTQFTANGSMTLDKFNKEYKYNIRHSYGKEGARINYKPWDCKTILSKPRPQKGEYHGCPYRDLNSDSLANQLRDLGIVDNQEIVSILDISSQGKYTNACTKVFEILHKNQIDNKVESQLQITHPNLYFERSRHLEKKLAIPEKA